MNSESSILFTQCLQNDFAALLDKYDPLPNSLHIGYQEANRLLGEMMEEGPVFSLLDWAYETDPNHLKLIHIRDWHDPNSKSQEDHLTQFGDHCLKNTKGAEFVFQKWIEEYPNRADVVNASGLNDFVDTNLESILVPYKGKSVKVGITGVWTEAKVTFLAYDLKTRYPEFEIGVCSALTASSSLSMHFIALDQLKQILGVKVFSSIGAFTEFLTGSQPNLEKRISTNARISSDKLKLDPKYPISKTDNQILLYLFRDCKEVEFKTLDGGFSGNVVLKSKSTDHLGHLQVPCVVKIGERDLIAKERTAFERIQEVLGNNAPSIVDFCELENRGAIKYRYAAMLDGNVKTFQKVYGSMPDGTGLDRIIDTVFGEQLGRLFEAAATEKLNLLEYYDFQSKYSKSVRSRVESLLGGPQNNPEIEIVSGYSVPNPCIFYEQDLLKLKEYNAITHNTSYVHGDLNGANIIIDGQENVWMIDFFHTHRGHIIRDLLKLENDVLFIFCKIESEAEWKEAVKLTDFLHNQEDLGIELKLDPPTFISNEKLKKAYRVIAKLRSYYPRLVKLDRDPYQMHVGALRYAMHTLSFDESNEWQRKWALYAGSKLITKIKDFIQRSKVLRIDYLKPLADSDHNDLSRIGLTILPGRKDRARVLDDDLNTIQREGITHVLSLITEQEYVDYGVTDLKPELKRNGIEQKQVPILDQRVPSLTQMKETLEWMDKALVNQHRVLIHCVGGLGRSGTVAAAYLIWKHGLDSESAIQKVRESRSERAVESLEQIRFLELWEKEIKQKI
ncbi:isochorismatase family protein [Leptospira congkakensis]|uniref:Isochorismatase family protein n=1 Tax=Leptospira congkakensis TaxID=2484932 RepID=A0A4Z1A7X7_9LEPT|nr:dual specificity protein phosphatase family protein [Leptospira congkakensis]TGL85161.1 isochorismatase family protein [Leptospira congkakensis]TGL92871.1 isochorismatase family protein [Leptospira congkakensis]TGL95609.1 isochorismatase family protein [Leptospira congkakensis]